MGKIDLSIIIVNFNTRELLRNCLESIKRAAKDSYLYEIIVVDNASEDGSKAMVAENFPQVKLIKNKQNLGFARANNQGIKQSSGRYLLLLNSDTLVNKETLLKMLKFMDNHQEYGAATCRVELADGRLDPASHRGFPTPWASFSYFVGLERLFPGSRVFGQYHQTWKDLSQVHPVAVISGAFFMIRRMVVDQVGGLDERFFIYAEDIDWCWRINEAGYQIGYYPKTKIVHFKKSSGRNKAEGKKFTQKEIRLRRQTSKYFFQTMTQFYEKHYQDRYPWLVRKLVLLGIWLVSKLKR